MLLSVAAAACAGTGNHGTSAHTTTTPEAPHPTTATTTSDARAQVQAVYQRYWQVWLSANNPPNPDDPAIAQVEAGNQLTATLKAITALKSKNEAIRLPPNSRSHHQISAVTLSKSDATLSDCAVDDSILFNVATGEIIDGNVQTQQISAALRLLDGRWKVIDTTFQRQTPGLVPCSGG